ncbi:sugar-binding protein [Gracilibacillus sp. YIM 98692]|uniref:sugar-binding protein n=1 Tax=Gracilibacillus sp. YIM 98692 TaxID=2663532 RepID=UPI0013D4B601|nr:sugar-binding protein [Gracilibacillus sp. YIM 98692]
MHTQTKAKRNTHTKTIGFILFLIPFTLMIYYGKETFYIEQQLTAENTYDYHFVLITEEVGNDYWRLIEKGAKEAAEAQNIYLEYIGPKVADNDERLATLDRMIAAGVDAIITKGMKGERFQQLVQKANNQNIPVATVDTDNEQSARAFYVGTDNTHAGYLAGETLINQTTGPQKVAIVTGNTEAPNLQQRVEGFQNATKQTDRIELIGVTSSQITELGAAQAAYQLLKQHPDLTAFFGTSALDGMGIVQAVEEMQPANPPHIIAFDTLSETLNLIEQEKIDATIVQYPEKMGRLAVELMHAIKQGKTVDTNYHTQTGVIDKTHLHNGELVTPIEEGETQ